MLLFHNSLTNENIGVLSLVASSQDIATNEIILINSNSTFLIVFNESVFLISQDHESGSFSVNSFKYVDTYFRDLRQNLFSWTRKFIDSLLYVCVCVCVRQIDVQSSNPRPISTSQTSVSQICPFSNSQIEIGHRSDNLERKTI